MIQDGQLEVVKEIFSSSLLFLHRVEAELKVPRQGYVYLLSDAASRAMLIHGHKDDVRVNLQRADR